MQINFIQEWEARSMGIFRDHATPMPYLSNHTQSKLSQQTNPRTLFLILLETLALLSVRPISLIVMRQDSPFYEPVH